MWPFSRKRARASSPGYGTLGLSGSVPISAPRRSLPATAIGKEPTVEFAPVVGRVSDGYATPPDDEAELPPTFRPITLELFALPAKGRMAVVGESHYQAALRIAANGKVAGDDFDSHIPVVAALIAEPENVWDPYAVRVDVVVGSQSLQVGYLPSPLAEQYQAKFLELRGKGLLGTCPAKIAGGGDKYYGIYLHLVYPEKYGIASGDEDPVIARIEGKYAVLREDWSCTVTREEDCQDVLRRYAPVGGEEYRRVRASLGYCKIMNGKYKGQDAIEVRIDEIRVGQLTAAMTARYAGIVDRVYRQGLRPTCTALVGRTDRGIEVELLMPPDPEYVRTRL